MEFANRVQCSSCESGDALYGRLYSFIGKTVYGQHGAFLRCIVVDGIFGYTFGNIRYLLEI